MSDKVWSSDIFSRLIFFLNVFLVCTVNETIDVVIDLSGKLIEIYVKPLLDCYIARVGLCSKAVANVESTLADR